MVVVVVVVVVVVDDDDDDDDDDHDHDHDHDHDDCCWILLDVDCWLMIAVHQQVSSNPWYQIFKFLTSKAKACRVFPQRQVLQPTPLPQPEVAKLWSCPCSLMSDQ